MTIPLEIAFESATPRVRSEDRGLVLPEKGVFAVFDGMGGGADADVAAEIACSHIAAASLKLTIPSSGDAFHEIIASLLCSASDAVYAHAQVHGNDAATTASLCILVPLAEGG